MEPKHAKAIRCSLQEQQDQHDHHHHKIPTSNGVIVKKSDTEDKDQEDPLVESFSVRCTTETSRKKSTKLPFDNHDDDDDDDSESEKQRFNTMFEGVRERREQLVNRLRVYNNLFKFHKSIKEDQVCLYRKLQDMDQLYLRNTSAILRLGFCPCLVHQQTSPVGDLLMRIHRKLRVWDKKMEEIYEILKEPSTRKSTSAVLKILKVCDKTKFGPDQPDFDDIALPEIVWDLDNPFLEHLNSSNITEDWRNVKREVRESLCKAEVKFQQICLEFGITRGPEQTPSESVGRPFVYENVSMDPACDDEEIPINEESSSKNISNDTNECGDSTSSIDTPCST